MNIPPFSLFSAISELFVTAGVLYVIRRSWTRQKFPFGVFIAVTLFEALINVAYMSFRTASAASGHETLSQGMRLAFAAHGMLSLLAYFWFVVLGVMANVQQHAGRYWFREHPIHTWSFLVVWTISIVSGEVMFVARYLI